MLGILISNEINAKVLWNVSNIIVYLFIYLAYLQIKHSDVNKEHFSQRKSILIKNEAVVH